MIKRGSTLFLKAVILLLGVCVLAGMIWFPQTEGRAVDLDLISIYTDPVILYAYITSIPFFVGLYQAIKLLNLIDANKAFSQSAVDTLKNMKIASLSLIGFIALAEIYLRFFAQGEDAAGPMALGIYISFAAVVIATAAAIFKNFYKKLWI